MEIDENMGCGLTEIKLPDTASVINSEGKTIFEYGIVQNNSNNKTREVVKYNNCHYTIYSRMDGNGYTLYLASKDEDYLAVCIKDEKVEYMQEKVAKFNDRLIGKFLS